MNTGVCCSDVEHGDGLRAAFGLPLFASGVNVQTVPAGGNVGLCDLAGAPVVVPRGP